jgi:hypothetical protein
LGLTAQAVARKVEAVQPSEFMERHSNRYVVQEHRHGLLIAAHAFPAALEDISDALDGFCVRRSEVDVGGGNKTEIANRLDDFFDSRGWEEARVEFQRKMRIVRRRRQRRKREAGERAEEREGTIQSHFIDCVKGGVAVDVEWNNKNTFFARDLAVFRAFHELGLVSVGVLITRGPKLQDLLAGLGADYRQKYGATTTHWRQLLGYVEAGAAGSCPLLLLGIEPGCYLPKE